MRELAVRFGRRGTLVGVVTEPDGRAALGVVLLSAGLTHRVGPQRSYVLLARRLAAAGLVVLRFDYSGVGDSAARADRTPFADAALEEASAAMDLLREGFGVARFLLGGFCWGADNAVRVAVVDPRVVAVAAIDFYAVASRRLWLRLYAPRVINPARWLNMLAGRSDVLRLMRRSVARGRPAEADGADALPVRPVAQVIAEVRAAVQRGVRLGFAFATGGASYDQYVMQFARPMRALAATGRLEVRVFENADHVFTMQRYRLALLEWLEAWVRRTAAELSEEPPPRQGGADDRLDLALD